MVLADIVKQMHFAAYPWRKSMECIFSSSWESERAGLEVLGYGIWGSDYKSDGKNSGNEHNRRDEGMDGLRLTKPFSLKDSKFLVLN